MAQPHRPQHSLADSQHGSTDRTTAPKRRIVASQSTTSLAFPQSATAQNFAVTRGTIGRSSRTWTASSGDLGLLSDTDETEDRAVFVIEYNRLAKKVRMPRLPQNQC